MSDQYVGEIRAVAFNFAPTGWALCQGQLLPISQNTALFSILGTMYGGNGTSTFGLPNLCGRVAVHQGQGPGLGLRELGEAAGEASVALLSTQMPSHSHTPIAVAAAGTQDSPSGSLLAEPRVGRAPTPAYAAQGAASDTLAPGAVGVGGGSLPHNNLPPYLVTNYIIALTGAFPPRG